MSDKETSAILGLKRDLKTTRGKLRELSGQIDCWRRVAAGLRKIAGLDEKQFRNLLQSESLTE
jgi:hypothetical protein